MTDASIPPGINELPDPTTFAAPPDSGKKAKKRRALGEPEPLAITSLMDIMTILLVFLLKSYSNNPVQLKQANDLKLPFSTSDVNPSESTAVTVTLNNIMVNDQPVVAIDNGVVPEAERSSGGFLIDPLFQKLQEEVENQRKIAQFNKSAKFSEVCTVIADRNVPFNLITQVMYTAGQATFSKFKFAVVKSSQ